VGVGTASPNTKFQVTNSTAVDTYIRTTNSIATLGFDFGLSSGGDSYLFNRNNTNLIFGINASERMRIDSSGNVLINTTTAQTGAKLAVTGGIQGTITSGTAVASTSGTSIDFTSIPSWVKRITVMFQGVSSNSTGAAQVQLGTSGGYVISGYLSAADFFSTSPGPTLYTTGFVLSESAGAAVLFHGQAIISNISGNNWVYTSTLMNSAAAGCALGAGSISASSLGGVVDRLRIIYSATGSPSDTFDAGSINILYEG